ISNKDELTKIICEIMDASAVQIEQYKAGKTNLFDYFVGQVMNRLIRRNANTVDLLGLLEVVRQQTDIRLQLLFGTEVLIGAVRLVQITDMQSIGIICGKSAKALLLHAPYVHQAVERDLVLDPVLCTQIDVSLHGAEICHQLALLGLGKRNDGIFKEICRHAVLTEAGLSAPGCFGHHQGNRLLPQIRKRLYVRLQHGKMGVAPQLDLVLAGDVGKMLPKVQVELVLRRRVHHHGEDLDLRGNLAHLHLVLKHGAFKQGQSNRLLTRRGIGRDLHLAEDRAGIVGGLLGDLVLQKGVGTEISVVTDVHILNMQGNSRRCGNAQSGQSPLLRKMGNGSHVQRPGRILTHQKLEGSVHSLGGAERNGL
ncbi:MAG: hypothetical protein IIW19_05060, partial [Clostridia bacterium]|nr:hypothetical protein [Clostridia bacterium]